MIPVEAERTRQTAAQVFCRMLLALTLAATAACTEPSYSSLSAGAEPLRTRFNQDAGKVRIIMLPAPT